MIKARMRAGPTWSDACILNLSSRGMLVRSERSPARGSYLEIRRGAHLIVARVIWSKEGRFGVRTQDPVPTDSLVRDPPQLPAGEGPQGARPIERRAAPRASTERLDASRRKSRAIEFGTLLLLGAFGTFFAGEAVAIVFGKSLGAVNAALAAN